MEIDSAAFISCDKLSEINIPTSVSRVGGRAFQGTAWMESQQHPIIINNCLIYYGSATGDITIPDGVTMICAHAFDYVDTITGVNIPEGVTEIGIEAFSGCRQITNVTIPKSLIGFTKFTFSDTKWFKENYEGQNPIIINDCLLGYYGSGESFTVPDGITTICDSSIQGEFDTIIIPDSVTKIDNNAFFGLANAKEIIIPSHIENIEEIELPKYITIIRE